MRLNHYMLGLYYVAAVILGFSMAPGRANATNVAEMPAQPCIETPLEARAVPDKEELSAMGFEDKAINDFLSEGGTAAYAEKILPFTNKQGEPLCTELWEVIIYYGKGISEEYAATFAQLSSTAYELILCYDYGVDAAFVDEMQRYEDSGTPVFDARDFIRLKRAKATAEDVDSILSSVDADFVSKYLFFGKDLVSFTDTSKPNALLFMGLTDDNTTNDTEELRDLIKDLSLAYDVNMIFPDEETMTYSAYDTTPSIDAVVYYSHGSPSHISFDAPNPQSASELEAEQCYLDMSDYELFDHFQNVNPGAVFFLGACSTGEGGKGADNLANYLFTNSPTPINVIAPIEPFSDLNLKLTGTNPLDFSLLHLKEGNLVDVLYKQRPEKE